MSRLKKRKSPWRAKLGAGRNDVAFGKSPWRAKLGAKKMQKRLKQKKHHQVKVLDTFVKVEKFTSSEGFN